MALAAAGETAADASALLPATDALPSSTLTWGTAASAVESIVIASGLVKGARWKGGISGMTILILGLAMAAATGRAAAGLGVGWTEGAPPTGLAEETLGDVFCEPPTGKSEGLAPGICDSGREGVISIPRLLPLLPHLMRHGKPTLKVAPNFFKSANFLSRSALAMVSRCFCNFSFSCSTNPWMSPLIAWDPRGVPPYRARRPGASRVRATARWEHYPGLQTHRPELFGRPTFLLLNLAVGPGDVQHGKRTHRSWLGLGLDDLAALSLDFGLVRSGRDGRLRILAVLLVGLGGGGVGRGPRRQPTESGRDVGVRLTGFPSDARVPRRLRPVMIISFSPETR